MPEKPHSEGVFFLVAYVQWRVASCATSGLPFSLQFADPAKDSLINDKVGLRAHFLFVSISLLDKSLQELLAPLVAGLGYELWGVIRLNRRDGVLLRIYIDTALGINISDCERVSRQVSDKLDVEDIIRGEYTLEVSSPGMDRPLFTLPQFQRYTGAQIKLRLSRAVAQRRNFAGLLKAVRAQDLVIEVDGNEVCVPLGYVEKANLVA